MGWLSDLFDPGAGYEHAQGQLSKYYQQGRDAETPYWQRGVDAGGALTGAAGALMDPNKLRQQWMGDYTESPEARMTQAGSMQQGMDTASSMGLSGSSPALQAIQGEAGKIGLQDKNSYLTDMMNKYMKGVGIDEGLYNTGASAGNTLANMSQNMGQSSANMAYGKTQSRQNEFNNILSKIFNTGGSGGGSGPTGKLSESFTGGGSGGSGGGNSGMMQMAMKYLPQIIAAMG